MHRVVLILKECHFFIKKNTVIWKEMFQSKNITESFTRGQCYINLSGSFMYVNKLVSFRKISLLLALFMPGSATIAEEYQKYNIFSTSDWNSSLKQTWILMTKYCFLCEWKTYSLQAIWVTQHSFNTPKHPPDLIDGVNCSALEKLLIWR